MKKFKRFILKPFIIMFIFMLLFGLASPAKSIYAATKKTEKATEEETTFSTKDGWIDHNDSNVYKSSADKNGSITEQKEDPGWLEEKLSGLFRAIADGIHWLLGAMGLDIDTIILGRIHDDSGPINYFGFELATGNPYGVVASVVFSILRSLALFIIGVRFVSIFVSGIWKVDRMQFKDDMLTFVLCFAAMFLIPYVLDLMVYIRDAVLSFLKSTGSSSLGLDGGLNIYEQFTKVYENSKTFVNSFMLLGTSVLGLWFGISYVGIALSMVLYFISIPIICIRGRKANDLLSRWFDGVLSNLLTPIIDYTLLLICMYIGLAAGGGISLTSMSSNKAQIVELILCGCIIPSRSLFQMIIGINSSSGQMLGMNGFAQMLSWGKAMGGVAKGVGGRIGEAWDEHQEAKANRGKAEEEKEQAAIANEEEQSAIDNYNGVPADKTDADIENNELNEGNEPNETGKETAGGGANGVNGEPSAGEPDADGKPKDNETDGANGEPISGEPGSGDGEPNSDGTDGANGEPISGEPINGDGEPNSDGTDGADGEPISGEPINGDGEPNSDGTDGADGEPISGEPGSGDGADGKSGGSGANGKPIGDGGVNGGTNNGTDGAKDGSGDTIEDESNVAAATTLDDVYQGYGESIDKAQSEIDSLNEEKAGINQENKNLDLQKSKLNAENAQLELQKVGTSGDEKDDIQQKIQANKVKMADIDSQKADNNIRVAELDSAIGDRKAAISSMKDEQSKVADIADRTGVGVAGNSAEAKKRDVLRMRANVDNFDTPEFQNVLTHEERAALYEERAKGNRRRSVASAVGAASAAVGGVAGFGAGTFMPSTVKAMTTLGGTAIGGGLTEGGTKLGVHLATDVVPGATRVGKVMIDEIGNGNMSSEAGRSALKTGLKAGAVATGVIATGGSAVAALAIAGAITAGKSVRGAASAAAGSDDALVRLYRGDGVEAIADKNNDIRNLVKSLPPVPPRKLRVATTNPGGSPEPSSPTPSQPAPSVPEDELSPLFEGLDDNASQYDIFYRTLMGKNAPYMPSYKNQMRFSVDDIVDMANRKENSRNWVKATNGTVYKRADFSNSKGEVSRDEVIERLKKDFITECRQATSEKYMSNDMISELAESVFKDI